MAKEIHVPDIGDFSEVEVIEVLVSAGDTISIDDALITLESDKASMVSRRNSRRRTSVSASVAFSISVKRAASSSPSCAASCRGLRKAKNGMVTPRGEQANCCTRAPSARQVETNSVTNRDLPMPASPETSIETPREADCARAPSIRASSSVRLTKVAAPAGRRKFAPKAADF